MLVIKEEVSQDWNSSLDQQHPEPPYIKEEEELWISREEEQLTVKIEEEKKPQLSELHQIETEDYSESKGLIISSTEQMEKGLDGEDCGGPEPDRNPDPVCFSYQTEVAAPERENTS
ncbi:hypothetical protein AMECASPLE_007535 [Ameca splendens]|uniref:Uncharacterized protein n=1 Tax=Ameca splendens TaxID=208324 RepID=A0ABV0XCS9_9TELE